MKGELNKPFEDEAEVATEELAVEGLTAYWRTVEGGAACVTCGWEMADGERFAAAEDEDGSVVWFCSGVCFYDHAEGR